MPGREDAALRLPVLMDRARGAVRAVAEAARREAAGRAADDLRAAAERRRRHRPLRPRRPVAP